MSWLLGVFGRKYNYTHHFKIRHPNTTYFQQTIVTTDTTACNNVVLHRVDSHFTRSYAQLVDYFKDAEPHKLDTSLYSKESWKTTKGLIFGMDGNRLISIPSASECNLAVFGPPGAGKTSGIAIIDAMQFDGSVLAVDIKGDIYNYVSTHSNRKILRFAPDADDALSVSCHFDPLYGFDKMSPTDQKLYLENVASILPIISSPKSLIFRAFL